jgi:hypothetical protein
MKQIPRYDKSWVGGLQMEVSHYKYRTFLDKFSYLYHHYIIVIGAHARRGGCFLVLRIEML